MSQGPDAEKLHQIIQPLNVIQMSCGNIRTHMLRDANIDPQYVIDKVDRIEEQIARAMQLLQDVSQPIDD